ncbi:MAG: YmdB family metallophosphoesterase [Oscillospiraceae bacterium]|jgi:metallophosphoesterase (TIGR00282 family)|nr:YmdB family metallophosphoesterase [Oscillospiraceae bacterium]
MSKTINVLAIGDVTGSGGLSALQDRLRGLQRSLDIAFTVVNGENCAGRGLFPADADAIMNAGADVITLGNHAFSKREIMPYLDDHSYILRPANYADAAPGIGHAVFETAYGAIRVLCLIGRKSMDYQPENPFSIVRKLLADQPEHVKFTLVDFHAEATSEKQAMAYMLDGRVSAIWGTHTHVQTADAQVLPGGSGFITDLGMTGPIQSVIGMDAEQSIGMFLGIPKDHYKSASGASMVSGAVFELDADSGLCLAVTPVRA